VKDKGLIENYTCGGVVYSSSLKYKAMVKKKEPFGAMVVREKFDHGLVKLAVDSGAKFVDGKTVEDIKISKEKAKIILDDKEEIGSEIVVGADGIYSTVAKKTGLASIKKNNGMCVFQEYKVDEKIIDRFFGKEKMCHIHLKFENIPGYGWVFSKKQHLNIGVVKLYPTKINLLNVYKDYFNLLKKDKIIPGNLKMGQCKGGALPLGPLEKTYGNRVILVGDAAGLINPMSGEGIYYAMSSGEIAAKIISESLENGDTTEKFLAKYQKNWNKDFGRDIKMFLKSAKSAGGDDDNFIRLVSKDEKLTEIALSIFYGSLSIDEIKWKLIKRYIFVRFKDLFSRE
jgi:geranylgeranyl reductase family protein